jgi:molybdate transport system substrate-binding protein
LNIVIGLISLIGFTLLPACTKAVSNNSFNVTSTTLTVMAASSLTEVFTELASSFEAVHPEIDIEFNFAGSQQLAQQLINGAQADVFASANNKQMNVVVQSGRIETGTPKIFAHNGLVLVLPIDNPAKITSLSDLAAKGIKIILAAPEVPVGQYSLDFLNMATSSNAYGLDFKDHVLANVVSYETTVKAVVVKVGLGEADAGIVYLSDLTPESKKNLGQIEIPAEFNIIADYSIAAISDGKKDPARLWIKFLLSDHGGEILKKHSFNPVQ